MKPVNRNIEMKVRIQATIMDEEANNRLVTDNVSHLVISFQNDRANRMAISVNPYN